MAAEIKDKYSAAAALTITLASLASSTAGVGRQSDMVDNSTTRYTKILLFVKVKQGTSPTSNRGVYLHAIRGDAHGTPFRSDGAGTSDAALTILNAQSIGVGRNDATAATGEDIYFEAAIENPGPSWGVALHHDTGANLDSTGSNHFIHWIGLLPEVQ